MPAGEEAPPETPEGAAPAASDTIVGSPPPEALAGSPRGSPPPTEDLIAEVKRLKVILDDAATPQQAVLDALGKLALEGPLSTKVLSDTLIGKSVNSLAKNSTMEAVRTAAMKLVNVWKQAHRKRKASGAGLSLDRTQSLSTASMDSELASPRASLTHALSQDTMEVLASPPAPEEDKNKMTPKREKIREKIAEALTQSGAMTTLEGSANDGIDVKDPVVLAADIETALNSQLSEKDYINQARAVLFNLKDKRNPAFKFKLSVGAIRAEDVPKLKPADMASDEKNAQRKKERDDAMAAIDQDWAMKNGQIRISGLFTCGKCKGTQTTYFQMQTRSSDEPMTTFASCLTCGNRWKFC